MSNQPVSKTRLVVVVALLAVTIGALTTFALWQPRKQNLVVPPPTPAIAAPAGSPATPATPKPFEYDAANNRHWDPSHGHWHPGPPPNASNAFAEDASLIQTPSPTNPNAPQPYEYDAETNRHWHPGHGHWHDGPPPAIPGAP